MKCSLCNWDVSRGLPGPVSTEGVLFGMNRRNGRDRSRRREGKVKKGDDEWVS